MEIYAGDVVAGQSAPVGSATPGTLIQTLNFTIPTQTVPVPELALYHTSSWYGTFRGNTAPANNGYTQGTTATFSYSPAYNSGVKRPQRGLASAIYIGFLGLEMSSVQLFPLVLLLQTAPTWRATCA